MGAPARFPIYVHDVGPDETFGMPHDASNCSVCYDPATRTKFWGERRKKREGDWSAVVSGRGWGSLDCVLGSWAVADLLVCRSPPQHTRTRNTIPHTHALLPAFPACAPRLRHGHD